MTETDDQARQRAIQEAQQLVKAEKERLAEWKSSLSARDASVARLYLLAPELERSELAKLVDLSPETVGSVTRHLRDEWYRLRAELGLPVRTRPPSSPGD